MALYIVKRLLSALPTLFIIITLSFFLMRVAPGGPFDLERPLEAKVMENLKRIYSLDRPLWEQYLIYLKTLLQGDLGPSFYWRDFSVNELFARALLFIDPPDHTRIRRLLKTGTFPRPGPGQNYPWPPV